VRFLVDASLSPHLASLLADAGHDAEHVETFDVLRVSDDMMLAFAASEERVLVSADADYEVLFSRDGLSEPSCVVFSSADALRPGAQAAALLSNLAAVATDLASGAIVTITGGQLRINPLPLAASLCAEES
jgi:predicted nuclease of predicted toxin-antitoxin system